MKKSFTCAALAMLCLVAFSACKNLEDHSPMVEIGVKVATIKYIKRADTIEAQAERAERIVEHAQEAQRFFDSELVAVNAVEAAIRARVAEENLAPEDQLLVDALITMIAEELRDRVGEGLLSPEQRVTVSKVLSWVEDASKPYQLLLETGAKAIGKASSDEEVRLVSLAIDVADQRLLEKLTRE